MKISERKSYSISLKSSRRILRSQRKRKEILIKQSLLVTKSRSAVSKKARNLPNLWPKSLAFSTMPAWLASWTICSSPVLSWTISNETLSWVRCRRILSNWRKISLRNLMKLCVTDSQGNRVDTTLSVQNLRKIKVFIKLTLSLKNERVRFLLILQDTILSRLKDSLKTFLLLENTCTKAKEKMIKSYILISKGKLIRLLCIINSLVKKRTKKKVAVIMKM